MRQELEPAAFSDPAFAERERARVFGAHWQLVGVADQLAEPRSHLRVRVGGRDWLLRRGADGELRCLANVCLHRGARICTAPSGAGPLRCGYHGWTYSDDGRVTGVPFRQDFPDLPVDELKLRAARVEAWGPAIFVNPDPDAAPLREALGPLFGQLDPLMRAMGPLLEARSVDVEANWKVVMENALETYHVGFIHRESIQPLGFEVQRTDFHGPHSVSHYSAPPSPRKMRVLAFAFPDRPVALDGYLHGYAFPNSTVATAYGNFFVLTRTEPLAPDRTRLHWYMLSTRCAERSEAAAAAARVMDESNRAFLRTTFEEDAAICASTHDGCREADGRGHLGAQERRVAAFERGVLHSVTGAERPPV